MPGKTNRARPAWLECRVIVEYTYAGRESVAYTECGIRVTYSRFISQFAHFAGVRPDRIRVKNALRPTRRWVCRLPSVENVHRRAAQHERWRSGRDEVHKPRHGGIIHVLAGKVRIPVPELLFEPNPISDDQARLGSQPYYSIPFDHLYHCIEHREWGLLCGSRGFSR